MLNFESILANGAAPPGESIGRSRDGRPIHAWRFGTGPRRVSLLAGNHADEPVGPRLLAHVVRALAALPPEHEALTTWEWWIIPHTNPDGAAANAAWTGSLGEAVDPVRYLEHVVRELPGDDLEFGFPRDVDDHEARPEARAIDAWWRSSPKPFALHASLHGMSIARGPWFLLDAAWADRSAPLRERCAQEVARLGYLLHDVDRGGDKGFVRIGPGFSTRPDSRPMAQYFRDRGDHATAALFRPTSMEAVRRLGGDPLTLVSEMPLLLSPRPEPGAPPETSEDLRTQRDRLGRWGARLRSGADEHEIGREIAAAGLVPMPIPDQMRLQWALVTAGIDLVTST
ncbi:MAG: peptidase [Gemmatimonadetes bacterium]|nr:peptidase [Gemmatimonadota bacterium]